MGLDINLATNNSDILFDGDYHERYFYRHSLSRTFCHLMCRRDVITTGQPELDQVGKLTGVDISHFYAMNDFPDEEGLEFFISMAGSEEEKQSILTNAANSKAKLQGNIGTITDTINQLIEKLTPINNLPTLLASPDFDTLNNQEYFAAFTTNKGDGYIGNNFGQDLRNFKSFLNYARSKGATTVYFRYG